MGVQSWVTFETLEKSPSEAYCFQTFYTKTAFREKRNFENRSTNAEVRDWRNFFALELGDFSCFCQHWTVNKEWTEVGRNFPCFRHIWAVKVTLVVLYREQGKIFAFLITWSVKVISVVV